MVMVLHLIWCLFKGCCGTARPHRDDGIRRKTGQLMRLWVSKLLLKAGHEDLTCILYFSFSGRTWRTWRGWAFWAGRWTREYLSKVTQPPKLYPKLDPRFRPTWNLVVLCFIPHKLTHKICSTRLIVLESYFDAVNYFNQYHSTLVCL